LRHIERFEVTIDGNEALNDGKSLGQTLNTMSSLNQLELRVGCRRNIGSYLVHVLSATAAMQSLHDVHLQRLASLTVEEVMFDERMLRGFLLSHKSTLQSFARLSINLSIGEQWDDIMALLLDEMTCLDTLHLVSVGMDVTRPSKYCEIDFVGQYLLTVGLRSMLGRA
jgi:hypothetical protein